MWGRGLGWGGLRRVWGGGMWVWGGGGLVVEGVKGTYGFRDKEQRSELTLIHYSPIKCDIS